MYNILISNFVEKRRKYKILLTPFDGSHPDVSKNY